jgi:ABC-type iron transport system FetAB ATPase subunit
MVKIKSLEESDRNRVEDSVRRAYLGGTQSLAWIIGIIRSSMFSGETLSVILDRVEENSALDEAKKRKMNELRTELKNKGFL